MKLSLCMIVRDNEDTLEASLLSIKPWVDEMIVVDTGSLDRTREIAERLGAKVSSFPWIDDFSAAHNASLERAQGEWIFWMDSDDTIPAECGRRLRELAYAEYPEDILGFVMQVHCPTGETADDYTAVDHVKLFRNDPRLRFEGRIHEQVLMPIRLLGGKVLCTDIYVVHSGASRTPEAKAAKCERDLRILHKDLEERPEHPFVRFNLGMTYTHMGEHDRAIEFLQDSLQMSDLHDSHVRKAFALMAICHFQSDRFQESLLVCRQGRSTYPDDPELLFREGMALHSLGDYRSSIDCYQLALRKPTERFFQDIEAGIAGHKCRFNLAMVFRDSGQPEMAELQWRQILDEHPNFKPARVWLNELLLAENRLATAQVEAQRLMESSETLIAGVILMARVEEKRGKAEAHWNYWNNIKTSLTNRRICFQNSPD